MSKSKKHGLEMTQSTFQARGTVTGVHGKRFYKEGVTRNGSPWNSVEFGIRINENKTIYVKLNGFPRKEAFFYSSEKKETKRIPWNDRHNKQDDGFRLIGVNVSVGKDENGKNVNKTFVEFDAVEHLKTYLQEGDSLFVKGNVEYSTYVNKNGETVRKTDLVPTQLSYTNEPIDFRAEGFEEEALFDNTIVYSSIEKEIDDDNNETGRFELNGYCVGYNDIVPVSYIIDKEHVKLANNLKKHLKEYNTIKVYGKVDVIVDTSIVEVDDDGWGETSRMERINSPVVREFNVFHADPNTIDTDTYSEKEFEDALRAIKADKNAEKNFGSTVTDPTVDEWASDDSSVDDAWE